MYRYTTKSGQEYIFYQGVEDPRKHVESAKLWFFVPASLFRRNEGFNNAFYSSEEAERYCEEQDEKYSELAVSMNKRLEILLRRSSLRVVRSSE